MEIMIAGKTREVIKIKPHELKTLLGSQKNILVYGVSGTGKSSIVREYCTEKDYTLVVLNLALEVPETIGGVPYADTTAKDKKEYFTKLLNERLKPLFENNEQHKVLFLDEINQAPQEVMNCLYSICDIDETQRNWAGHPLVNTQVIAAGNKTDGDDGTVYLNELPTPLHNRFFIFELVPDKTDTRNFLKEKYKNIPQVVKYIDVLLENDIPPRDIDNSLEIIQYDMDGLLLQSKIGSALTAKLYDIQKKIKTADPAKTLKLCRQSYEIFKDDGVVQWAGEEIDTEEALLDKFREILSEEEVKSIVKGEE